MVALSVVLLGLAVVVGALVGWYAGDHSLRDWTLSFGGSAELFGLLLVASPELVPILQRVASLGRRAWRQVLRLLRKVEAAFRRLLRRPLPHVVSVGAGGARAGGFPPSGRASVGDEATLEEKVDYLLRRDQDVQDSLERLEGSLAALPGRWKTDVEQASQALRDEHARALAELRDRHMQARLLGVVLLAVGIVLATAGNLV
jgi:hypothetical protein